MNDFTAPSDMDSPAPVPADTTPGAEALISDEEALKRVLSRFHMAKKYRQARELTWWLCAAFYLGDHYAEVNRATRAILTSAQTRNRVPPYRVRAVINMITPGVNELVARMVRSMPTLSASPKSEDPDDYDAALAASAILKHEWRRSGAGQVDQEARLWSVMTGTGAVWTRWNQGLGPLGQDGAPAGETELHSLGPFSLYPDPGGGDFPSMRWFAIAFEDSVEALREEFPHLRDKIGAGSLRHEGKGYEDEIHGLLSASLGIPYTTTDRGGDTTTLIHHYEPRSSHFPDGLLVICTATAVLYKGPNPWAHFAGGDRAWAGVNLFRYWQLPGQFWGKGPVEEAIKLQKQLNRTYSQILEQRNEACVPKWLLPRGMKIRVGALSGGGPGAEVWYTPPPAHLTAGGKAYKPDRVEPPRIPSALFKLMADTIARIEDLFAYHQVSKGGAPPGVRSGIAIESLQETDQSGSIPVIQRHNMEWSVIGQRMLNLAREMWTDERVVEVRGDDGYAEIRSFRGADIPQNLDVVVDSDVMLPVTRAGKLGALMTFVERKILTPEEAREAIFGGFGTIRAAVYRASLDQKKQWRENMRLKAGQAVHADNFDNHVVHLKELNDFRKTPTFTRVQNQPVLDVGSDGRPRGMTTVGALFELHAQEHAAALLLQVQASGVDMAGAQAGATGQDQGQATGAGEPATANPSKANASGPLAAPVTAPDSGG